MEEGEVFTPRFRILAAVAVVLGAVPDPGAGDSSARQTAPVQYTIVDVGTLGGLSSVALAVNEHGQVVGSADTPSGYRHAYLWEDGVMTDLGTLGVPNAFSEAWSINNLGQIVGNLGGGGGLGAAFFWEDGVMVELGDPAMPKNAYGINDAGQVVGAAIIPPPVSAQHAFLWENGVLTDLGTLGGTTSIAWDINETGVAAGSSFTGAGEHAVIWIDGAIDDLGTLGGTNSEALGINDLGHVVGESQHSADDKFYQAFLWEEGMMVNIGSPAGFTSSEARAINNAGQIVGGPSFLYDPTAGMHDLHDLIPEGSSWSSLSARDINDTGQIVGDGTIDGRRHAFIMNPLPAPVPASSPGLMLLSWIGLAVTAAVMMVRRRSTRDSSPAV